MNTVISLQLVADEVEALQREMIALKDRIGQNSEALKALREEQKGKGKDNGGKRKDKVYVTPGSFFMKVPIDQAVAMIERDQAKLESDLAAVVKMLRGKMAVLQDLHDKA